MKQTWILENGAIATKSQIKRSKKMMDMNKQEIQVEMELEADLDAMFPLDAQIRADCIIERERTKDTAGERTYKYCRTCGKLFSISHAEHQWLRDQGWELPAHCKKCRKERKALKNA